MAAKVAEEEDGILEAMREYTGPMTKPRASFGRRLLEGVGLAKKRRT